MKKKNNKMKILKMEYSIINRKSKTMLRINFKIENRNIRAQMMFQLKLETMK